MFSMAWPVPTPSPPSSASPPAATVCWSISSMFPPLQMALPSPPPSTAVPTFVVSWIILQSSALLSREFSSGEARIDTSNPLQPWGSVIVELELKRKPSVSPLLSCCSALSAILPSMVRPTPPSSAGCSPPPPSAPFVSAPSLISPQALRSPSSSSSSEPPLFSDRRRYFFGMRFV